MFAAQLPPANWLLCNGATLLRAAPYDKLFAVLGTTFNVGTVAADNFMLPEFDAEVSARRGPAESRSARPAAQFESPLATAELPSHAHTATETAHTHAASQPRAHSS